MAQSDRELLVLPNPFSAPDYAGNPGGAVQYEPDPDGFSNVSHRGYIGAAIDEEKTQILDQLAPGDLRSPRQNTVFKFNENEPIRVPLSGYYLEKIREGALIAANEYSARLAGVAFDIEKARTTARERLIARLTAEQGSAPAWASHHPTGPEAPAGGAGQTAALPAAPGVPTGTGQATPSYPAPAPSDALNAALQAVAQALSPSTPPAAPTGTPSTTHSPFGSSEGNS